MSEEGSAYTGDTVRLEAPSGFVWHIFGKDIVHHLRRQGVNPATTPAQVALAVVYEIAKAAVAARTWHPLRDWFYGATDAQIVAFLREWNAWRVRG